MASIKKTTTGWRVFVDKKGVRKNKTFKRKTDATVWAAKTELEIEEGLSGNIPNKTVGDLLDRYENNVSRTKKGWKWERDRINFIKRDELGSVNLRDLNTPHVAAWRDRRLKLVTESTVRREWNLLSHAFNVAIKEWHWLRENPLLGLRKPKPAQPRDRLISEKETELILHTTGFNNGMETKTARVGAAFLFAIETGMRAGEISGLRPEHITDKSAFLEDTKNGTSRYVPLSKRARELLKMVDNDFKLSPMQISSLFIKSRKMAGIEDLHFHDTRHAAITQLADKLDVLELARMVGIKDLSILMVYYNKTADELADKLG